MELFTPDPSFIGEKIEYIEGFGAKIVRIVDDEEEEEPGGWFNWKAPSFKSALARMRNEDEGYSWF